jgi:hypothetical protein
MKASLVAYDFRELHKKSELKIVKYGYLRGCTKRPTTQFGLLEILGVKYHYILHPFVDNTLTLMSPNLHGMLGNLVHN